MKHTVCTSTSTSTTRTSTYVRACVARVRTHACAYPPPSSPSTHFFLSSLAALSPCAGAHSCLAGCQRKHNGSSPEACLHHGFSPRSGAERTLFLHDVLCFFHYNVGFSLQITYICSPLCCRFNSFVIATSAHRAESSCSPSSSSSPYASVQYVRTYVLARDSEDMCSPHVPGAYAFET